MKILHINTYDHAGGAEQFAYDMAHATFAEAMLAVKRKKTSSDRVVTLSRQWTSYLAEYSDKIFYKLFRRTLFADYSVLHRIHGTYRVLSAMPLYRDADVIHLHNIHFDYFDLETLVEICREKSLIWTLHDMWSMTGGEPYTFENENYRKGTGQTPYGYMQPLNNPLVDRRQQYLEKKKELYQRIGDKIIFVPVSYWLEDCLKNSYVYNDQMDIRAIRNGIDTSVFYDQQKRTWTTPRILFFNSDNPFKGAHLFRTALKQLSPDFDLYVVGQPVEYAGKQVNLAPVYDRKKLNDLYNQVDILVFPSEAENFSLLVIEAMAAGVCVVGAATGGIVEQLEHGTGVLFERSNSDALAGRLQQVFSAGLEEVRAIGTRAAIVAQQQHNCQQMQQKYMELYESLQRK